MRGSEELGIARKDETAEDLSAGMQTPYDDRSEESDNDAVCPKCGLTQTMGLESNVIFGMT